MTLTRRSLLSAALAAAVLGVVPLPAPAAEEPPFEVRITIKNHRFEPAEPKVPAGRPIKLIVTNADDTPEEFESVGLKIERVILPGKTTEFTVRPLAKNRNYKFFGEFNPKTAQGQLIVE